MTKFNVGQTVIIRDPAMNVGTPADEWFLSTLCERLGGMRGTIRAVDTSTTPPTYTVVIEMNFLEHELAHPHEFHLQAQWAERLQCALQQAGAVRIKRRNILRLIREQ